MVVTSYPPYNPELPGPQWPDLAKITTATHRRYCEKWGYDYFEDCSDTKMPARTPFVNVPPPEGYVPLRYFVKFHLLDHFLNFDSCREEYETVVWLDADCVVTNYDRPLTQWPGEIVTAYDVNAVHPTVIIVRKSPRSRGFIWACNNTGRTMFQHHEWSDNEALRYFSAAPPYKDIITYYSAQDLCAMTPGVYPIPPDIRAQYEWTANSWTLHLSALSIERRIEIAKQYIKDYNLL